MAKLFAKCDKNRPFYVVTMLLILVFGTSIPLCADTPKLALAQTYQKTEDLAQFWVSEKLDGVRAYWDGSQLISRQGNRYIAPDWFVAGFPEQPLDGELWINRGNFESLLSTVRKMTPVDAEWQNVKYMVFDSPASSSNFTDRLKELESLISSHPIPHLQLVEQFKINDHQSLQNKLKQIVDAGGEGLMLHRGNSFYRSGRTGDILKVKVYQDAEAVVIAHLPGKGKYKDILGAILVETPEGKRFKIGSGFKDEERKTPPPIGAVITYKYFGLTRKGIPKFASYLRIRKSM